jgi:hypothetical protein
MRRLTATSIFEQQPNYKWAVNPNNYPVGAMGLRHVWNNVEPNLYLALYSTLAPFKEGRRSLAQFTAHADPVFAQPNYLAFVVMNPVQKICTHLLDISYIERIVSQDEKKSKYLKIAKYKLLLKYYIMKQYLKALVFASKKGKIKTDGRAEELSGADISKLTGVTEILLNLPREYQRWNEFYKQQGKQITPTEGRSFSEKQKRGFITRPFDVSQPIDETFRTVVTTMVEQASEEETLRVQLQKGWDPLYIVKNMLREKTDVQVSDMYKSKPEYFDKGEKKKHAKRKLEPTDDEGDKKPKARRTSEPETMSGTGGHPAVPDAAGTDEAMPSAESSESASNALSFDTIREIVVRNARKLPHEQRNAVRHVQVWNGILQALNNEITGYQKSLSNKQRIGKSDLKDDDRIE